jgi:subtilisin family serine protease
MTERKRSLGQIVFTLSTTAASLFGAFFALIVAALTCDESCDDRSSAWRDNPDAWQWTGQLGLAAFATLASIWALVAAIRRRSPWPAVAVSAIAWATWWIWLTW